MGKRLEIRALGGLTIEHDGQPITSFESRKVPALLLYLAHSGRSQAREVLGEMFWPCRTRSQTLNRLGVVLSNLRKTIDPALFLDQPKDPITLNPDITIWLDVHAFEHELASGLPVGENCDPTVLEGAIALYQGDFLEGFHVGEEDFDNWGIAERERLRLCMMDAADILIRHYLDTARYRRGIQLAARILQMDDLRERTHCLVMDLLCRSGQRIAALRQYDTLCRALASIDAEPVPETLALMEEIRRGTRTYDAIPAASPSTNPCKGLFPFNELDAPVFFGREAMVAQLLAHLRADHPQVRFLAVVGPSGSGKSSVVRAGLIPALRDGALPGSPHWRIAIMMPGAQPFVELEDALLSITNDSTLDLLSLLESGPRGLTRAVRRVLPSDHNVELLLVIDQFEELFALVEDKSVQELFLTGLHTAVNTPHSRLHVIITLRGDFYDRPLLYNEFGELVRERTEVVLPLDPIELERAIVGPAKHAGIHVDSDLIAAIVADVGNQPGTLPLLQHTLWELFESRSDHALTLETYRKTGGVRGAMSRRADILYEELTSDQQEAARQLFLRLVRLGEGTEDTRWRVPWSEVAALAESDSVMRTVADRFGKYRLLTFDHDHSTGGSTIEIAHEALIREWAQFRLWLDEGRHDIRQQRMLATFTTEWQNAGQDRSYLLHGSRLQQFASWAEDTTIALTASERIYLDQSIAEQQHRDAIERERQQREVQLAQRAAKRLRYLVAAMAIFLVVSILLTGFALNSRAETKDALGVAEREAAVNRSLVIADRAEEAHEAGLTNVSLALALEAVDIPNPPPDAVRALKNTAISTGVRAYLEGHEHTIQAVTFGPAGARALSGGCAELTHDEICTRGEMILWDVEGPVDEVGAVMRLEGHSGWINSVAISPGGLLALSASDDGTLALWDIDESSPTFGDILYQLEAHNGPVNSVAFSPDGSMILSGGEDHTVILWDTASREILHTLDHHEGPVNSVAFAPDGQSAASASDDTSIIEWNLATGMKRGVLKAHTAEVLKAIYTPDGSKLISRGRDLKVYIWDVSSATVIVTLPQIQDMGCLEMTPDGHWVMICEITALGIFDTDTWRRRSLIEFREKEPGLTQRESFMIEALIAAASPDGSTILLAGTRGLLGLLTIETQGNVRRFDEPGTHFGGGLAVSPDNQYLLAGTYGSQTLLWNLDSGALVKRFDDQGLVTNKTVFSPDGRIFVASSNDFNGGSTEHTLVAWDVETEQEVSRFEDHMCYTYALDFSPDGQRVLSGSFAYGEAFADLAGGDLYLWNVRSGQAIHKFDYEGDVGCVDFSSDGTQALVGQWGDNTGHITIWDTDPGSPTFGQLLHQSPELGSVQDCSFSPTETTYFMASNDGNIYERDVNTDAVLRTFVGHDGWVMRFDFRWDQGYMISGDTNGVILLWDLESGEELRRFVGHTDTVWELIFSRDGQYAFSSSYANDVIQWQIADWTLEELLAWIPDNRYVHELTCGERAQYDVTPLCE